MRVCPYCMGMFSSVRLRQEFCGDPCRLGFHKDVGAEGVVAGVTRLKRGVSVVVHFPDGPAAERAIALRKGQAVRTVPAPQGGD
jgi:hypothetical protein